eukprot:scaffold5052_cov131-Isochrysis_galbana.AAC.1
MLRLPKGSLLHTLPLPRAEVLASGQWSGAKPAVRGKATRCHRRSRGRAIIPGLSSHRCCQRGLTWSPCPRSYPPRSAPAGAVGAPSLPSTRSRSFFLWGGHNTRGV